MRKISRQFWDKENQLVDILKAVEKIRETRNLFIHGVWHPGNFEEPKGFATVTDLKTEYENKGDKRSWKHGQTLKFCVTYFQEILDSVNSISYKIENLCELFKSEDDINFGQEGLTASSKPFIVSISSSGNEEVEQNNME